MNIKCDSSTGRRRNARLVTFFFLLVSTILAVLN